MSKCKFTYKKVEYLDHILSDEGVKTDPNKVKAMVRWPRPTSVKSLKGFLILTGYYKRFIKGYGSIVGPLTQLLKKENLSGMNRLDKYLMS
jgi:hypothetical protein